MYFKHAVQLNTLKQLSKKFHWEICHSWKKALLYCSKSDTRIDGPWCFGIPDAPIRIPPLKDWQQDLLTIIDQEPDSRTIYWCWEKRGNVGKSHMSAWLTQNRNAITVSGNVKDIAYILSECTNFPKIIIIDIPRSNEQGHISYSLIEQLKTGMLCSTKYKGRSLTFNIPHVVIFANREPDFKKLSMDRWKVFWIHKKQLIIKNIITNVDDSSEEVPEGYCLE